MYAKKQRKEPPYRLTFLIVIWLFLPFSLLASCAAHTDKESAASVFLTPDRDHATATPFQPGSDSNYSPYDAPTSTITLTPTATEKPTITATPRPVKTGGAPTRTPFVAISPIPSPPSSEDNGLDAPVSDTSINPLTGLMVNDPSLLERRPIAVKITLFPRYVRPQSGLSLADVVFEYYIEDGLTRFIAVFYGNNAAMAGPVRSGRFFDEHVARMYQAFFVFKYADPRVYDYYKDSDLKNYLVVPGNGACPPFVVGQGGRDTYNNIFLNTVKFKDCIAKREGVDNTRPAIRSNFFSYLPPQSALPAEKVFTQYSPDDYHYWEYIRAENRYLRYQEMNDLWKGKSASYAPLTDALTNASVKADNVVVLFVSHRFANSNEAEDEVYHIDLYGSGPAFVFRDGLVAEATWSRTELDQPLLLTTELGTPAYLKPGVTFYQVIGASSESWNEGADWHFMFAAP
ncbi:MAG: DUF3048 domain-containing protein [Chloroflexota bacterium]